MKVKYFLNGIVLLFSIAALNSCAPVFSEMQSARTVGEGAVEVIPSYSYVSYSSDGESDGIQNHLGTQLSVGVSENIDIRLRYEYIWLDGYRLDDDGTSVLGIGPKFGLLKDRIAFSVPIGCAFGYNSEDTWQFHPTLLLTLPAIKNKLDINLSPKYLITISDGDNLFAINLGLSLSSDLEKWSIRPEYGMLFNPGEDGHYSHFSIGIAAAFGR